MTGGQSSIEGWTKISGVMRSLFARLGGRGVNSEES